MNPTADEDTNQTVAMDDHEDAFPELSRRRFLQHSVVAGAGVALAVGGLSHALPAHAKQAVHGNSHNTAPNQFIEANGTRYAYRKFGKTTGTPVVFIQHFRGTMDDWDPAVTDGLGEHFPVVLFDNVGIGLSSGKTPDNFPEVAKDAAAFIDALGLKKVHLLGFSIGGFVAQLILLDRPELIDRAILAGTGPQGGEGMQTYTPEVLAAATRYPLDGTERPFLFFTQSEAGQKAAKEFLARVHQRKVDPDKASTIQTMQAQGNASGLWGKQDNAAYNERLGAIKHPVLVANGYSDLMIPSINAYSLARHIPNAQLIMYPDAGHGALFQYHDLFVKHATLFLT